MVVPNEKTVMAAGETDSSKPSTLNTPDMDNVSDTRSVHPERPTQDMTDDLYPHGLELVLLAGASISAVFLISLDQVSTSTHLCRHRNNDPPLTTKRV